MGLVSALDTIKKAVKEEGSSEDIKEEKKTVEKKVDEQLKKTEQEVKVNLK